MRLEVHITREILDGGPWKFRNCAFMCPVAIAIKPLLKSEFWVNRPGALCQRGDMRAVYEIVEGREAYEVMMKAEKVEDVPPFVVVYDLPEDLCLTN